ncbi:glycosyltransferase family 2 protein, partial [bacterium]|nr:glycosyltransferase family 2 protein [bacterium]
MSKIELSIIIPVYNEEGNVQELFDRILLAMSKTKIPYETIFVDDGSTDSSSEILSYICRHHEGFILIRFRKNFGQTASMQAGIDKSRGKYICFLDGDLQNDPDDIEKLYTKASKGYDIVSGWRHKRKDKFISRKLPSMIA